MEYLVVTLTHSNGQSQGNAKVYCEYLAKGDKYDKHLYWLCIGSCLFGFRLVYLHLTLARSKGQGQSQFECEKF